MSGGVGGQREVKEEYEEEREVLAEHGGAGSELFWGLNSIHRISITKASSAAGRRDLRGWLGKYWRKWIHYSNLPPTPPLPPASSTPFFLISPLIQVQGLPRSLKKLDYRLQPF